MIAKFNKSIDYLPQLWPELEKEIMMASIAKFFHFYLGPITLLSQLFFPLLLDYSDYSEWLFAEILI